MQNYGLLYYCKTSVPLTCPCNTFIPSLMTFGRSLITICNASLLNIEGEGVGEGDGKGNGGIHAGVPLQLLSLPSIAVH